LKDVEKLNYEELRSDFREEYVVLEKSLFKMVENPRKLSGRVVTGEVKKENDLLFIIIIFYYCCCCCCCY